MELLVGIEPTTCSLRVSCSTPEPQKHIGDFQNFLLSFVSSAFCDINIIPY